MCSKWCWVFADNWKFFSFQLTYFSVEFIFIQLKIDSEESEGKTMKNFIQVGHISRIKKEIKKNFAQTWTETFHNYLNAVFRITMNTRDPTWFILKKAKWEERKLCFFSILSSSSSITTLFFVVLRWKFSHNEMRPKTEKQAWNVCSICFIPTTTIHSSCKKWVLCGLTMTKKKIKLHFVWELGELWELRMSENEKLKIHKHTS